MKDLFENIEENPAIVENYINAGIVLSDVGEIEKAERFFQKALTIEPENGAVYYNLANIYYNEDWNYKNIFKNLGPEPLIKDFSVQNFYENLSKRQSSIKSLLLNQSIISGLGNIYVCESLFLAKISPFILGCELSLQDIEILYSKIKKVLTKAIKEGGTTLQDYKNISGEIGYFQNYLSVYNKEYNKCINNCAALIKRETQNGRSTYYCPNCQK